MSKQPLMRFYCQVVAIKEHKMGEFFNLDNPVFSAINKFVDMIFLSIVYIIICIPIITIGPATTALYYTVVKNIRRERGYPLREFFRSFKDNFKQGFVLTLIFGAIYLVLYVDLQYARSLTGSLASTARGIFIGMLLIVMSINLYVFPYLSRFEAKTSLILKSSLFLAIKHLPSTILMLVVFLSGAYFTRNLVIIIFIIPAATILIQSFMMERIFKKYMPEKSEEDSEKRLDEWYLD